jgi:hypothetical protein
MMEGAHQAKWYVTQYLAHDLPSRLIRYRNEWNVSTRDLPNPVKYYDYDIDEVGHWPSLITVALSTGQLMRSELGPTGDPIYRVRYSMRTYIWARHEQRRPASLARDRLTTVVRAALLDHPALSTAEQTTHCEAKVDEGSMREEFSELFPLKGERWAAASFISYDLELYETIERDPLSDVLAWDYILTVERIAMIPSAPSRPHIEETGDEYVKIAWRAPGWDGGGPPISGYKIEQSENDGTTWATAVADTGSTVPVYTVTGLTNGTAYNFRVSALTSAETGTASDRSRPATPSA